jgi:hypothetical protein
LVLPFNNWLVGVWVLLFFSTCLSRFHDLNCRFCNLIKIDSGVLVISLDWFFFFCNFILKNWVSWELGFRIFFFYSHSLWLSHSYESDQGFGEFTWSDSSHLFLFFFKIDFFFNFYPLTFYWLRLSLWRLSFVIFFLCFLWVTLSLIIGVAGLEG